MRETVDFDAFYAATSRRMVGQLFAMTGDLGEAEDALQEAYIRAWQQWPKIGAYESPEGWVRSVAFKLCVNAWWKTRNRLTAHRRAAPRSEAGSEPELGPNLLALVQALRQLPERQRRVLVLHYVADLSVEQITRETGMPAGTVKSYLSRGRAALAPLVSEFSDEGEPVRAASAGGGQAHGDGDDGPARKDYGYA
jgi:RNA polymerase sigma-70 factor (ECF subfamily)